MECRTGSGACCIAPSISTPLPGMPDGKPAGVSCVNLREDYSCKSYQERPAVCRNYQPSAEYCGCGRDEAMRNIEHLEKMTAPVV